MTIFSKKLSSQQGISIIGAIFTLIILGIFGATIVVVVTTEHEARRSQLSREWAFYDVQAGFEYALREIDQGGYPLVSDKPFSRGIFSIQINYDEVSKRDIISSAVVGDTLMNHQISYDSFGGDCLFVDYSSVTLEGFGDSGLSGMRVRKVCNEGVNIDKIVMNWTPNGGEKAVLIIIDENVVWDDVTGAVSGTTIDIDDTLLSTPAPHQIDVIRFTSNMSDKEITVRFIMTDSSFETVSFIVGS